jgi:succinate dehydrogenase / fumarate reductase iron-sulfur subunit
MEMITVRIARSGPAGQPGSIQQYDLEIEDFNTLSVLNLLELIYRTQDKTLSFFDHASCRQAACGRCSVKVNGKIRLACRELVSVAELLLEPYKKDVVKDLVCR